MRQIFKESGIFIVLLVFVFCFGAWHTYRFWNSYSDAKQKFQTLSSTYEELDRQYNDLKAQTAKEPEVETKTERVILESNAQFGAEASFAPLSEIVLDDAKLSGIRLRSIEYNYAPQDDAIVASGAAGYNVCELKIKAVGSFSDFQSFFKRITREEYLITIAEVKIEPWENDRKILIGDLKIRLYTKITN